jgi:glycosyltransferase involved in cell wall biosynthesis
MEPADITSKAFRILKFYARLFRYTASTPARIFHILWNNKLQFFDRTFLMLYYKLLGKKIVFTAHNVNAGIRDGNDSFINQFSLRVQYSLCDHIFVHTEKMKTQLLNDFNVDSLAVSVIPFGINHSVPDTDLTAVAAKRLLGIEDNAKTILFFGAIRPYKGLEYLVDAFFMLAERYPEYRLIVAGAGRKETEHYLIQIQRTISNHPSEQRVIQNLQYISDSQTELYFKAADLLALPYTEVFQSGVLFLSYSFGLPVVATDVGSIGEDIVEGKTGFLCKPRDPIDLAKAIEKYFESDLFKTLESQRSDIREYARERHSWELVGDMTRRVYVELLEAGK